MRTASILVLATITCVAGCSTTSAQRSAAPPPFECTSIYPEVCQLEEQFHKLRFEQAEQISSIEDAERRRKEREQATATAAAHSTPVAGSLLDTPSG